MEPVVGRNVLAAMLPNNAASTRKKSDSLPVALTSVNFVLVPEDAPKRSTILSLLEERIESLD